MKYKVWEIICIDENYNEYVERYVHSLAHSTKEAAEKIARQSCLLRGLQFIKIQLKQS